MDGHDEISGPKRRRERQRREMRADILEAARGLVDRQGAHALTMRAVAEAIGYSPAAIYEYFGSKNEILEALYFQGSEGLNGRTRQVVAAAGPNASMLDRIAMAGRAYRAYALEHPDLYQLIFSVRNPGSGTLPADREQPDSSFGTLIGLLAEAVERGEVAPGDPVHMAAALWAFVHGFVMLELSGRLPSEPPGETDRLFEAVLDVIGYGLLPRTDDDHARQSGPDRKRD